MIEFELFYRNNEKKKRKEGRPRNLIKLRNMLKFHES